ncbi:MAG: GNAT family N-acetyltransferase [Clostridia bacterium]|nr:GNAT family N-acetyltransferase [Clostridia bacterium]
MEKNFENITLRFPETEAEWKEIIKNQCEIFGDSAAFYDDFYIWAGKECTLAAFAGGEIVGAVNFPEITYPAKEKTLAGGYIFAAWVKPEHRGKGIFASLMSEAEKIMRARGYAFAFVVPAEEELFAMYEKMGYALKVENGFPYSAPREILREYNPTDDIYMLWKVYSRVQGMPAKDMEFFNHTMRVFEEEGKFFAISKRGYIVYAPCYDNTVTVYDRMEKGSLVDSGKRAVRGLCKLFCEEEKLEKLCFNAFFEPTYEIFGR